MKKTGKKPDKYAKLDPSVNRPSSFASTMVEMVGSAAGMCTTAAFLPQVWTVYQTGETDGLSLSMYCIFVGGVFLWILYGVCKRAGSLVAANLVTFLLAGYILSAVIRRDFFTPIDREEALEETISGTGTEQLVATLTMHVVAVCAAGPLRTFTHPRVHAGLRDTLCAPSPPPVRHASRHCDLAPLSIPPAHLPSSSRRARSQAATRLGLLRRAGHQPSICTRS